MTTLYIIFADDLKIINILLANVIDILVAWHALEEAKNAE